MNNFAAIDFETANGQRESICSVGIVIVQQGIITANIYKLIRPRPNYYSGFNTRIHGIRFEDTLDSPEFPEIWEGIAPRIDGLPLVAHNSPFDEGCLKAVYRLYGMRYPDYRFFCTCRAARKEFPFLYNHRLPTVARHCGYDLSNHHHALADAEACAAIAVRIL